MHGLRSKLLLGFGGLLLIVLVSSILSETVMVSYSRAIGRSYREDYDSVAACQHMKEAAEGLDLLALNASVAEAAPREDFERLSGDFERYLDQQRNASTLPGEREATDHLNSIWRLYLADYPPILSATTSAQRRREIYLQELHPEFVSIRSAAQRLIDVNLAALMAVPHNAQAATDRAHWAMRTLTGSAFLLAVIFAVLIGRIILRPVRALTRSVQEVERGNFDLSVPIRSRDELGSLATAFNTMAARLREYRQLARERLQRTEQTMQMAIDSLPDVVLVTDPAGRVELANRVARDILPGSNGKPLDLDGIAWFPDLRTRIASSQYATELSDYGSTVRLERGGEVRDFLPRMMPIHDEAGKVIGTTVVLADVTQLRRLDEAKNSLLSLVSHELKTPLTSARMILHLLPDQRLGPLNGRQLDLLTAARDDIERLHRIVENLLDMSRIESGKTLMDLQPIAPADLVRASIEPLQDMVRSQQVELRAYIRGDLPPVMADPVRIGHVFANLLTNSLRYTPAGGVITLDAGMTDGMVEFGVRDTGAGIAPEHLPRIFEKFFRVPGQSGGGSGLGLAIAKDIVEAHGGRIRAASTLAIGTTIAFTLRTASPPDSLGSEGGGGWQPHTPGQARPF